METLKRELLRLERQFWQAVKDGDVDAAERLTDFPCILAGPQGVIRADAKAFASMTKSEAGKLQDFTLDQNAEVRTVSDEVAVIAYKAHENLTVEGEPVALDAAQASVWVRRNGKWRCAMHMESLSGDPYGRDRQAVH